MNHATRSFVQAHADADVHTLSLQASKYPDVDMALAVRQIAGRQKTKKKIPLFYHCPELLYPAKLSLEQASSEVTARHKASCCSGKILIDLTGGFGVDSCFFSFTFDRVVYVEQQEELCRIAAHNFVRLGRHNIHVEHDLAENYLKKIEYADWIYLDPARRTASGRKAVLLSDCTPDVGVLSNELLRRAPRVMIKLSPMIDASHVLKALPGVEQLHLVAVANECKELVAILSRDAVAVPRMVATHYAVDGAKAVFEFRAGEEEHVVADYAARPGTYLYEPNAAIMKSGAFKLVGNRMGLAKLHVNSHLYTSDTLVGDFPGRIFKVDEVFNFSKSSLARLRTAVPKAHIAVRNFPLTPDELQKKLKIPPGDPINLFATTLHDGSKVIVSGQRVGRLADQ